MSKVWVCSATIGSLPFRVDVTDTCDIDDLKKGIVKEARLKVSHVILAIRDSRDSTTNLSEDALVSSFSVGGNASHPFFFSVQSMKLSTLSDESKFMIFFCSCFDPV